LASRSRSSSNCSRRRSSLSVRSFAYRWMKEGLSR
jgi:hypothetical protein